MSDIVIRPARQAERSSLEALQWRASLANSGDRDALLANPDAIALTTSDQQPVPFMFPPPTPWKQPTAVNPTQEYVAFTSRFSLRSVFRVPAFFRRAMKIMKQADAASGIVGWSLGGNLFTLDFYTLSAWQDAASLRRFVRDGDHLASLAEFEHDMRRKSIFVYYTVAGRDLPLSWKDALARQEEHQRHQK